jgi:head-tail adaptor
VTNAGHLGERLAFQKRVATTDGYGNAEGAWQTRFTVAARVQPLKGGEAVLSARLSGVQPVIIVVRMSSHTKQITAGWRAVDARTGTVYALTSPAADMEERRMYLTVAGTIGEPQ